MFNFKTLGDIFAWKKSQEAQTRMPAPEPKPEPSPEPKPRAVRKPRKPKENK